MRTPAQITEQITDKLERAQTTMASFNKNMGINPRYAMENSDSMFEAAAFMQVGFEALRYLENEPNVLGVEKLRDHALRTVMNAAHRATSKSTSPCTNLMNDCITMAWSEILEACGGL
jgi:hypothetical protein